MWPAIAERLDNPDLGEQFYSAGMTSCNDSLSDDECSDVDLSSDLCTLGKKSISKGRWTKQEVSFEN